MEETLGFAQGQEEMVISLWSTEEAREGRQGVLQEVGSICSESGDKEWALGYHAGRVGGGCLGSVCKGDRTTCHQEH